SVSGNSATEVGVGGPAPMSGGGVSNVGTMTLTHSPVSDNTANHKGGGIYNHGTLSLTQSSVSDNTPGVSGARIYHDASSDALILTQSSVFDNNPDQIVQV